MMYLLCLFLCRDNVNINDVLGDYSLTLVDTLDTLVVCVSVSVCCMHVCKCMCMDVYYTYACVRVVCMYGSVYVYVVHVWM